MNQLLSIKLVNYRSLSLIITLKRSVMIQDKLDLGVQMKQLNDRKEFKKTLELFDMHKHNNIKTFSNLTITQILKACANVRDIQRGSIIHHLISSRVKDDSHILVSLIHLYMQCGEVARAESLFAASTDKVLPMYGAMMKGYVKNKMANKAIDLFYQVKNANEILTTLLFNSCAQLETKEALAVAKKVAKEMPKSFYSDPYILTSLLNALMKCGDVTHVQSLFDASNNKTQQMYGVMMNGYIHNSVPNKAIDLFHQLKNPNEVNLTVLFNACAHLRTKEALDLAKQVSQQMPKSFYSDPYLLTSLLDALMKCGDVTHAEPLFHASKNKTQQMYGAMMKGYIDNSLPNKALDLFHQLKNPDEVSLTILFNACAHLRTKEALDLAKQVSQQMPKSSHSNPHLSTSLLDALMKCGDVTHAESLFHASKNKIQQMFGAMMKGYIHNSLPNKAIDLFHLLKNPNEVNLTVLFNACAHLRTKEALDLAKQVSQQMPKSSHSNPHLLTSLLDALMKCGDVTHAEPLFHASKNKTQQIYGAMMKGYIHNSLPNKALDLFHQLKNPDEVNLIVLFNACAHLRTIEALDLAKQVSQQMPKSSHSNPHLSTSLLDALIKCGDISSAEILFQKITQSSTNYGILMSGFNEENHFDKTLSLFHQMKLNGVEANFFHYLNVIKASSRIGDFSLCQSIIKQIPPSLLLDNQIQTTLVDMRGRIGYVDQAKEVFQQISQPDRILSTAMINSYGLNGMGTEAVQLYCQMPQDHIDDVTNVCVLNACSHAGLVNEAQSIFRKIQNKTQSIFTTMIDCLSRASFFDEAQTLIDEYEQCHSPVVSMYMALLSGARNEKNIHVSQNVYNRMKKLFPEMRDPLMSAAVLLANVYASSGELDKSSDIKIQMHKSGVKKKVGLTWTAPNGELFKFRAHDQSHPQTAEIYAENERISQLLLQHGHQYDSSWVTRSLDQDETVASVLCGHSERLAIAWNFVANPNTKLIQVTKNLRVCGDCHRSTKLIAAIRQCEIIVRDANRIHHFYPNGQCSCNDYF